MNQYLITKLKEGRVSKGLKQSDVTKLTGIKNTTLSNYENGVTEPDIDTFLQLCELYGLDYADILGEAYGLNVQGTDFDIKPSEIEHIKKYRNLDSYGQETVTITLARETERMNMLSGKNSEINSLTVHIAELESTLSKNQTPIRMYSYMRKIAAAGSGFYFDDIPTDTIAAPHLEGADFIIGVSGDSMEPTYHDGDLVYVEKQQVVNIGDIGVFMVDNECYIKEAGEHGLISHNKNYPMIPGNDSILCVGKVIGKVDKVV